MFPSISGRSWCFRPSFRTIIYKVSKENLNCQSKFLSNDLSRGYAVLSSIKNFNHCRYETFTITNRFFASQIDSTNLSQQELDPLQFDKISEETLESLTEYFDELVERAEHLRDADVSYGDGVLTVKFGGTYGTYVINRQTPNKQIWLSSPKSGPKRYDFINGTWIYKHDGKSMHQLLDDEIPTVVESKTTFSECLYGSR